MIFALGVPISYLHLLKVFSILTVLNVKTQVLVGHVRTGKDYILPKCVWWAGLCYNELECLAGGGTLSGYCSPAALGVCCVFTHKNCGRTVKQKVSYFTNPNYPLEDTKPIACLLKESEC